MAALVQIMSWHRTGGKPLSEPMFSFCHQIVTHICLSVWVIIGSDNGLSPVPHQAIIYNTGTLRNNFKWNINKDKQRVLMHGHQGWNVRHGLCHIYMIYVYIWVVYSFCLFCCLFIVVTTQFVALYKPCKPKPKPSTYDPPPPGQPPPGRDFGK